MLWRNDNSCGLINVAFQATKTGPNVNCSGFVGQSCYNLSVIRNSIMNRPDSQPDPQGPPSQVGNVSADSAPLPQSEGEKGLTRPRHFVFESSNWRRASLTVVVPTYNEASNLEELVRALFSLPLTNLRLVIVDDDSPDGTGALADELAHRYNELRTRITVVHRRQKGGLGTAYVAGFRRALSDGADFVVQMDADFSHSPSYIPQMLGVIYATGMDVVIGSRYVPGGTLDQNWNWWRNLLSKWANTYCRSILRIRVRDMTAGFKLWQRTALQEIKLDTIRSNGYIFQVEMAYLSEKLGYHIIELPIHFEDRRVGQSKLDVSVKLESIWRVWELLWRHRKRVSGNREPHPQPRPVLGSSRPAAHQ